MISVFKLNQDIKFFKSEGFYFKCKRDNNQTQTLTGSNFKIDMFKIKMNNHIIRNWQNTKQF